MRLFPFLFAGVEGVRAVLGVARDGDMLGLGAPGPRLAGIEIRGYFEVGNGIGKGFH